MPLDLDKLPMSITEPLQGRGHSGQRIHEMTWEEAFDEYCEWYGMHGWGPELRNVIDRLKEAAEPNR